MVSIAPELVPARSALDEALEAWSAAIMAADAECPHEIWCEQPTRPATWCGSAIGPVRICLRCRREHHGQPYSEWSGAEWRRPKHVNLVLTADQAGVETVYALRLPDDPREHVHG